MRLQQYILEGGRSTKIDDSKIGSLLTGAFSQAYKQFEGGNIIYRHRDGADGETVITKPGKKGTEKRRSAYAYSNHYTLLLNNLPSWSKMPQREIICTFNYHEMVNRSSHNMDECYFVFPRNGAKIGICPEDDIFRSFSKTGLRSMNDFDAFFDLRGISDDSWFSFVKDIKKTENDEDLMEQFLNTYPVKRMKSDGMIEYLNKLLDPKRNGFKLQDVSSFKADGRSECWTDSPCLMINYDNYSWRI